MLEKCANNRLTVAFVKNFSLLSVLFGDTSGCMCIRVCVCPGCTGSITWQVQMVGLLSAAIVVLMIRCTHTDRQRSGVSGRKHSISKQSGRQASLSQRPHMLSLNLSLSHSLFLYLSLSFSLRSAATSASRPLRIPLVVISVLLALFSSPGTLIPFATPT